MRAAALDALWLVGATARASAVTLLPGAVALVWWLGIDQALQLVALAAFL